MRPISAEASPGYSPNLWNLQRVLHTLAATQEVPRHTRLHSRGSTRVPPTPRGAPFPPASSRGGILSLRGLEKIPGVPVPSQEEALSTRKARGTPGSCHIPRVPQMSQSIPGKTVFPALPRISSRGSTHNLVARGTALWESLVGMPPGKASRERHKSLDPREGKRDSAATAREESARVWPQSRRGLTPLGRLQEYPKIHDSTGEESSGSGTDSTQGLRPWYLRERNPQRPQSNSHGDWPFMRPPERVPEVSIVRREHLPHLEKIQEVLPSRRDEAHFH